MNDVKNPEDPTPSLEEQIKTLGEWSEVGGGQYTSPTLKRHLELLGKVRDILQEQVESDKAKLSQLHNQVQQMKHGGGS